MRFWSPQHFPRSGKIYSCLFHVHEWVGFASHLESYCVYFTCRQNLNDKGAWSLEMEVPQTSVIETSY